MIARALLVWVGIAAAEVLHGILRVRYLNPRVGDHRARQIAVFTGCLIILAIAWAMRPWIGADTMGEQFMVGAVWFACMLAFDVLFGRFAMRFPWRRIAVDFDLRKGGLLGVGMLFLLLAPWIAARL